MLCPSSLQAIRFLVVVFVSFSILFCSYQSSPSRFSSMTQPRLSQLHSQLLIQTQFSRFGVPSSSRPTAWQLLSTIATVLPTQVSALAVPLFCGYVPMSLNRPAHPVHKLNRSDLAHSGVSIDSLWLDIWVARHVLRLFLGNNPRFHSGDIYWHPRRGIQQKKELQTVSYQRVSLCPVNQTQAWIGATWEHILRCLQQLLHLQYPHIWYRVRRPRGYVLEPTQAVQPARESSLCPRCPWICYRMLLFWRPTQQQLGVAWTCWTQWSDYFEGLRNH